MSIAASAARFEAASVSDNSVSNNRDGERNGASRLLSSEALSGSNSFTSSDLRKNTEELVNKNTLPPLQIAFGLSGADQVDSNINGQTVGDKTSALREMQMTGDKVSGAKSFLTAGDKDMSADTFPGVGDKANSGKSAEDFSKAVQTADLKAMQKSLEEKDPNYDCEVDSAAESIGRDGSLGNGPQGEANRQALEKHMQNGTLDEFVDDLNKKLEKAGSPYRVSASQFKERMKYTENVGEKSITPREQVRDNNRANITITNTQNGRSYTNKIANDPSIPGYYAPRKADDQL